MQQIIASKFCNIFLGYQGENLARQIAFDLSDWISEYGPGRTELIYQRPGDAVPYPVALSHEGSFALWNVTSTDTNQPGNYGACELRYYVGETLAKSKTWKTYVYRAMGAPSSEVPPEPQQGWVDQVLEAGAEVQAAADAATVGVRAVQELNDHPSIPGKNGFWMIWDLENHTYVESSFPLPDVSASGEDIGSDGGYYLPSIEESTGMLSWTASKEGMPAVEPAIVIGPSGKTAYQYAQDGGYDGTEEEFAAKLAAEMPTKLPNPNTLTFTGTSAGSYDGSAPLEINIPGDRVPAAAAADAGKVPVVQTDASYGLGSMIPAPETAEVGQTVVVKAVDADGKPTEWETADMELPLLKKVVLIEAATQVEINADEAGNPFSVTKFAILFHIPASALSEAISFEVYGKYNSGNGFIWKTIIHSTSTSFYDGTNAGLVKTFDNPQWLWKKSSMYGSSKYDTKYTDLVEYVESAESYTAFGLANWSGMELPAGTVLEVYGR